MAVKSVDLRTLASHRQRTMVAKEIRVLHRLSGVPDVAKLIDVIHHPTSIHFVLEYIGGGSLQQLLRREGPPSSCAVGWGL